MKRTVFVPFMTAALFFTLSAGAQTELPDAVCDVSVSYLGPEGTYTQQAAELFFEQGGTFLPQETVADTVDDVLNGVSDYAVIPQENTIGGPVIDYVDELLSHEELVVEGEIELPIRQALLVSAGTSLSDIRTVYSHKQGIAQSKDWLNANLPQAEVIEVSSTAEGAKMVSDCTDHSAAAIASTQAAKVYGLEVLAESIQQNEDNVTRFYVVSDQDAPAVPSDRMTFTATGPAGALPALLEAADEAGLTLVSLHDRPAKTTLGQYVYVIECMGGDEEVCKEVADQCGDFSVRYLGSYSVVTEK